MQHYNLKEKYEVKTRYMLFAGSFYYPLGGMADSIVSSDDMTELIKHYDENKNKEHWQWGHILHLDTGTVYEIQPDKE